MEPEPVIRLEKKEVYMCNREKCGGDAAQNCQHIHITYVGWVPHPHHPGVEFNVEETRVFELCYN